MDIYVKKYPDCLRQAYVKVGKIELNDAFDHTLTELAQHVDFPGYRKGKVPADIIEKNYQNEVAQSVIEHLVHESINKMSSDGIRLYSNPKFQPLVGLSRNSEFTFSLVFEIEPELLKDIDISKANVSYDEYFIDEKMIEQTMRRSMDLLDPVTGKIKSGDVVTVKVLNKDYFPDNKQKAMSAEAVDILIDKKAGDTLDIPFDNLKNYVIDYIGVIKEPLNVEIVKVERPTEKPIDDELVKQTTTHKTVAELKDSVKRQLEGMSQELNAHSKSSALVGYLRDNVEYEFPKSLFIDHAGKSAFHFVESNYFVSETALSDLLKDEKLKTKSDKLFKDALSDIVVALYIEDFAEKNNIEPSKERINYLVAVRAQEARMTADEYKKKLAPEELERIQREAKKDEALSYITQQVKFTVKNKLPLIEPKK
jgi:trigger factor